MRKICCLIALLLCLGACGGLPAPEAPETPPALEYSEWEFDRECYWREALIDTYTEVEIDGIDIYKTTEGSVITAYYDGDEALQIVKVNLYGETFRCELRYYLSAEFLSVVCEDIRYSTPYYWEEEETVEYVSLRKMLIKDGQLYYFVDRDEPLYMSDNQNYLDIYETAIQALEDDA